MIAFPNSAAKITFGTQKLAAANALPSLALIITIGTMLPANASASQMEKIAEMICTGTLALALASAFLLALVLIKMKERSAGTN